MATTTPPTAQSQRDAAAAFLESHAQLEQQTATLGEALSGAREEINRMIGENNQLKDTMQARDDYWKAELQRTALERNIYIRYAVELAAQTQFIVSGAARALKLGQIVREAFGQLAPLPATPDEETLALEAQMSQIIARAPAVDAIIASGELPGATEALAKLAATIKA